MGEEDREPLLSNETTEIDSQLPNTSPNETICEVKVYKRRWYILLLFSAVASTQGGIWITWGPLADAAKFAFDWSNGTIALLGNWGPIPYILTAFYFSWLVDVKGLRFSMLLTAFCMWLGAGLRCITSKQPYVTWLMHTGQFMNGIAGPIAMAAPPLISALWFPAHRRSTSTGLMMSFTFLFIALSYILGPIAVPGVSKEIQEQCSNQSSINFTEWNCSMHKKVVQKDIMFLMYCEFGLVCVLMLMVLVYFPSKPSIPPSLSAATPRVDFKQGMKDLSRQYRFWTVALAYGLALGVQGGWSAVLDVNLSPLGVSQLTAGWIGFSGSVIGQFGIIGAGLLSDFISRRIRCILVIMYTAATVCFVLFAVVCAEWFKIPVIPALFVTNALGSIFSSGSGPLFYELCCESAYPVNEGLTAMMITWLVNVFALIFLLVLMIPQAHTAWMNWCLAASFAVCVPVVFFYKEAYKRLDIDAMIVNVKESDLAKQLKDVTVSEENDAGGQGELNHTEYLISA